MLIKIQNIEDENQELMNECETLKRKINRMLEEEKKDKETGFEEHEQTTSVYFDDNQKKAEELKVKLFTFTETVEEDGN